MEDVVSGPSPLAPQLRVFLCHSSGDKPTVLGLYKRLKADLFLPWLDEEEVLPGQEWQQAITTAVRSSHIVLVCLSSGSVTKEGFLQKEIKFALDVAEEKPPGTIFIIPVRLDPVDVPDRLTKWHWANLFEVNGYDRLVRALKLRAASLGIPVPDATVQDLNAEDVFHPPGTEVWREELHDCTFQISARYDRTRRWESLADVLVELREPRGAGEVYLIPSGLAPAYVRDSEQLKRDAVALERKRTITREFLMKWAHKPLAGKWFWTKARLGRVVHVYALSYDLFLGTKMQESNAHS